MNLRFKNYSNSFNLCSFPCLFFFWCWLGRAVEIIKTNILTSFKYRFTALLDGASSFLTSSVFVTDRFGADLELHAHQNCRNYSYFLYYFSSVESLVLLVLRASLVPADFLGVLAFLVVVAALRVGVLLPPLFHYELQVLNINWRLTYLLFFEG